MSSNYSKMANYCTKKEIAPSTRSATSTGSHIVVPSFGAISYDTLQRSNKSGVVSNGSYVGINHAYNTSACKNYANRSGCNC
jgi:hypothetical protein